MRLAERRVDIDTYVEGGIGLLHSRCYPTVVQRGKGESPLRPPPPLDPIPPAAGKNLQDMLLRNVNQLARRPKD